ncbi:hypothetical protein LDO31_02880 [Luteimonas sp. XNQY3]|nr:hypothetical protein [Luteimonas sp. XNQY3]MCD9005191.1 hypothetical protein [Luteimonas sp. XNQY3]
MDDKELKLEMLLLMTAMEGVLSALARRAMADPRFSMEVSEALLELTAEMPPDRAARVIGLSKLMTGEG